MSNYDKFTYGKNSILIKKGAIKITKPYGDETLLVVAGSAKEIVVSETIQEVEQILKSEKNEHT